MVVVPSTVEEKFIHDQVLLPNEGGESGGTGEGATPNDVNRVARQLYCPVCPNTPLDVCETQACSDWRELIRTKLNAGESDRQIIDYFVAQYGERVLAELKPGDFVLMQFGANDNGGRGALKGAGSETETNTANGRVEIVHTFGWYLRQFVREAREQGATPILCSLTPRKNWTDDGHFRRDNATHVAWTAEVAYMRLSAQPLHRVLIVRIGDLRSATTWMLKSVCKTR